MHALCKAIPSTPVDHILSTVTDGGSRSTEYSQPHQSSFDLPPKHNVERTQLAKRRDQHCDCLRYGFS